MAPKPIDKFRPIWFGTRSIDRGETPGVHVMYRGEREGDAKLLFVKDLPSENGAIPAH
jgi:hypothetical protein